MHEWACLGLCCILTLLLPLLHAIVQSEAPRLSYTASAKLCQHSLLFQCPEARRQRAPHASAALHALAE